MTAFFEKIQIKMCCEHWRAPLRHMSYTIYLTQMCSEGIW